MSSNDVRILVTAVNSASEVLIKVQADAKAASSEMQQGFDGAEGSSRNLIKSLAELAAGMAVFMGVSAGLHDVFNEMNALQNVTAQTNAVLKSTGDVSGVTAEQVSRLATALEGQSTFSKAAVQGAENMLLTFTNIGGSILPKTTQTVLDMSAAFKAAGKSMDISDIAIQVGKALNDPIKGITALQRVGVTFSESQKEMIKHLVETGQGMQAQQIILDELSREFGGSAKAATESFGGELTRLKNEALTSVAEFLNANLLPRLKDFLDLVLNQLIPAIQSWIANDVTPFLKNLGDVLDKDVMPPLRDVGQFISDHQAQVKEFGIAFLAVAAAFGVATVAGTALGIVIGILASPVTILIAVIAALGVGIYEMVQHWDAVTAKLPIVGQAWDGIRSKIDEFRQWVTGTLLPQLQTAWDQITSDVAKLSQDIQDHWDAISQIIGAAMAVIQQIVVVYWAEIKGVITASLDAIRGIIATVTALIHGDWSGAWTAIKNMAKGIWDDIITMLSSILGAADGIVATVWNNVGKTTENVWRGIVSTVQGAVNAVLGLLGDMVHGVGDAVNSLAGISILGKHPFGDLGGIGDALKGFNPSVNLHALAFSFTPIGPSGGDVRGGNLGDQRNESARGITPTGAAQGTASTTDTTPEDAMSGAGGDEFNQPKGAGGHGGKGKKPKAGGAAPSAPGSAAQEQNDLNAAESAYNHLLDQQQTLLGQVHEKTVAWTQQALDGLHQVTEGARDHATALNAVAMEAQKQWMAAIGGYDATSKASKTYTQDEINLAKARYEAAVKASDDATKDFTQDVQAETKANAEYDAQVKASYAARRSMASDQRTFDKDTAAAQAQMMKDVSGYVDDVGVQMVHATDAAYNAWQASNAAVLKDEQALTGNLSAEARQQLEDQLQKDKDIRDDAKLTADERLKSEQTYITEATRLEQEYVNAVKAADQAIIKDHGTLFDLNHQLTHLTTFEKQAGLAQWLEAEKTTIAAINDLEYQLAQRIDDNTRKSLQIKLEALTAQLDAEKEMAREASVTAQDLANQAKQQAQSTAKDVATSVGGGLQAITAAATQTAAALQAVVDPLKALSGIFQAPTKEELALQAKSAALGIRIARAGEGGDPYGNVRGTDTTDLQAQKAAIDAQIKGYADERAAMIAQADAQGKLAAGTAATIQALRDHTGALVTAEDQSAKSTMTLTMALHSLSTAMGVATHAVAVSATGASLAVGGALGAGGGLGAGGIIGHFQSGGVVPYDQLAYVHAGELVVPANRVGSVGGGGTSLTVVVQALDPQSMLSAVPALTRAIDEHLQRGGGRGLVGTGAAAR